MLPAKELDFRVALGFAGRGQCQAPSRLEDCILFEQQLNSYLAFQTLGFRNPGDGNIGGFRMTDEATPKSLK